MTTIQKNKPAKALLGVLMSFAMVSCQEALIDGDMYKQTFNPSSAPVCSTDSVFELHAFSARFAGQIQSVDTLLDCGVMLSEIADFSNAVFAAITHENGAFEVPLYQLSDSTTYYFRTYAVNPTGGGAYGPTKSFTTPKGQQYLRAHTKSDSVEVWNALETIDKDGDGYGWDFVYSNLDRTEGFYMSYSWNNGALFPKNYLLLPPYDLNGVYAGMDLEIYPSNATYFSEAFQVVASTSPITAVNCASAEVIHETYFTDAQKRTIGIHIPDHYLGGKIYLGIVHTNCADNDALLLTGITVYCDK